MVSAMTSYSSLTSRRIFVSRQHWTESDFEFPSMTKVFMKSCLFIVWKTMLSTIGESQAVSHAKRTASRIVNLRRGRFDTEKSSGARTPTWNSTAQATKMETASTNSGAEGTSLSELRMLKYFKSKCKRFGIINLNKWANIAVTKHVLLADEFIPYRPRLLGFHSLHVNAIQCIYVGFSLSKLQSLLNSRLKRLGGFNNKISTNLPQCSTRPSGKALARCVEESQTQESLGDVIWK